MYSKLYKYCLGVRVYSVELIILRRAAKCNLYLKSSQLLLDFIMEAVKFLFLVQNNMTSWNEHIIKYHHGGELAKEGLFKYQNGSVTEFCIDPDKLCYWDVLGHVKELGYDIKKAVELSFVDDGRTLKVISDDQDIIGLVEQLRKHKTVNVYVENSRVRHDMPLLEILLSSDDNLELDVRQLNYSDSESSKDEEMLIDVPFIEYN